MTKPDKTETVIEAGVVVNLADTQMKRLEILHSIASSLNKLIDSMNEHNLHLENTKISNCNIGMLVGNNLPIDSIREKE